MSGEGCIYAQGTILYYSSLYECHKYPKFCSIDPLTAIMDATTCQYDCSYPVMDFRLLLVVLKSPGYLLLPLAAMVQLSVFQ